MTQNAAPVAIEWTEREGEFVVRALREWSGSASWLPLPIDVLGMADWAEFDALTDRLVDAVKRNAPLSELDWQRVQFLTELSFASDLVGAGVEFGTVTGIRDHEGIDLLRSLQRKIINVRGPHQLFPGRGRNPRPS